MTGLCELSEPIVVKGAIVVDGPSGGGGFVGAGMAMAAVVPGSECLEGWEEVSLSRLGLTLPAVVGSSSVNAGMWEREEVAAEAEVLVAEVEPRDRLDCLVIEAVAALFWSRADAGTGAPGWWREGAEMEEAGAGCLAQASMPRSRGANDCGWWWRAACCECWIWWGWCWSCALTDSSTPGIMWANPRRAMSDLSASFSSLRLRASRWSSVFASRPIWSKRRHRSSSSLTRASRRLRNSRWAFLFWRVRFVTRGASG